MDKKIYNFNGIENKLKFFQIYHEIEVACKNHIPLFETQYSDTLVKNEKGKLIIDPAQPYQNRKDEKSHILVTFHKSSGNLGEILRSENKDDTELQEFSLMNNTYFCAINRDKHLDMKLDYTKSRIFQEMSFSELKTLHHLCELERTQILKSLASAVLKIPYAGYLLSGKRSSSFNFEAKIFWYYTCIKKFHHFSLPKIKDITNEALYSIKKEYIL